MSQATLEVGEPALAKISPTAERIMDTAAMRSGAVVFCLIGCVGAAAGCGFQSPDFTQPTDVDGGMGDAGCTTFSSQFDTCELTFGDDLVLSGAVTYDTDTGLLMMNGLPVVVAHRVVMPGGPDDAIDVIYAQNVRLEANTTLRATGDKIFGIVASGTITLEAGAVIDVSDGGAGAQSACSSSPGAGETNDGGGGGGGGAGFGTAGGAGGKGDSADSDGGAGTSSIGPFPSPSGGCPGARGGNDPLGGVPATGGAGGRAGGAIYLAAGNRIALRDNVKLNAGGGGGGGGGPGLSGGAQQGGGGGGGGSGGVIFLETPRVEAVTSAVLAANGGGGGEGGEDGATGMVGQSGQVSTSRALGGLGLANNGGDGARGGSRTGLVGESVTEGTPEAGGGGGGGGVGYIHIISPSIDSLTTSPEPSATGS